MLIKAFRDIFFRSLIHHLEKIFKTEFECGLQGNLCSKSPFLSPFLQSFKIQQKFLEWFYDTLDTCFRNFVS